jgi:diamine N-acetyltransferase
MLFELAESCVRRGQRKRADQKSKPARAKEVSSLRLAKITPKNVVTACQLELRPGQDRFVATVAQSLAEAYAYGDDAWPRLVIDGDNIVAFLMAGFKDGDPFLDSTIWRLLVDGDVQRQGYGRFAVRAMAREAKKRGRTELYTSYVPGRGSPEGFYLKLGFEPTGRTLGEIHEAVADVRRLLR